MQTIENSFLEVAIDEDGAQVQKLILKSNLTDFLRNEDSQNSLFVAFPQIDPEKNLALKQVWTIIDKGDTHISLALVDTTQSYHRFNYHFSLILTYELVGNQLQMNLSLKNTSNQLMPCLLGVALPLLADWQLSKGVGKSEVTIPDNNLLTITTKQGRFEVEDEQLVVRSTELGLSAGKKNFVEATFSLT